MSSSGCNKVGLNCRVSGCGVQKKLTFNNQLEFERIEKDKSTLIWFCHLHREAEFVKSSILSYHLLEELIRIATEGEVGSSTLYINKSEIEFLKARGLIAIGSRRIGARLEHPVTLTEAGQLFLRKQGHPHMHRK